MFQDRHPFAGGPDHYAAYLEDDDGYEVELVAETDSLHRPITAQSPICDPCGAREHGRGSGVLGPLAAWLQQATPLSSRLDLSESSPIGDPIEIPLGASTSGCGCGAGRALTSDAGARHRRVGGEQLPVLGPAEQCLGVGSRR